MRWMIVMLALAACDETLTVPKPFASGTRLEARVTAMPGGAEAFEGWHDNELDVDCELLPAEPGGFVCLPVDGFVPLRYSDAECKTPALYLHASNSRHARYTSVSPTYCGRTERYQPLSVGAQLPAGSTVYSKYDSGCEVTPAMDGFDLYAVKLDHGDFVWAEAAREHRGSRLDVDVIVAEDGARQLGTIYDRERDAPCVVRDGHCLPDVPERTYTYLGEDCATPGWAELSGACGAPEGIVLDYALDVATCSESWRVRPLGDTVEGGSYVLDDECYQVDVPVYTLGEPLPLDDYPRVDEGTYGVGRLRIRTSFAPGSDEPLVMPRSAGVWWDSVLGLECRAFGDRCMPVMFALYPAYSDEGCTVPVFPMTCPMPRYVKPDDHIYEIGDAVAPAKVYESHGGCSEAAQSDGTWFARGREVDISEFALIVPP